MKHLTISSLFVIIFIIQWQSVPLVTARMYDAHITGITQKQNEFFTIQKDPSAKSGWAIIPKKDIKRPATDLDLFMRFFTRTDPKGEFKSIATHNLCFLLSMDNFAKNYLSREIAGLIFSRKYERYTRIACEFRKEEADNPMDGKVHAGAGENRGTYYPEQVPYELEAHLLNKAQKGANNQNDYLIKVSFDIGKNQTGEHDKCKTK